MNTILDVKDLVIHYETDDGCVYAVNGLDLDLREGETLGLVGETGAGKTTLARGIMGLVPDPPGKIRGGEIVYRGTDLLRCSNAEMRKVRGRKIAMIFQDPMTSLNPVTTVGVQIAEAIQSHEKLSHKDAMRKACQMLEQVGIPAERAGEYPHQFSGGMKQRVVIAIALACHPDILIADEPTTALDVTIQAQVLDMLRELRESFNMSMLLITHDLGVVAQTCDRVAVIYGGEIVESADVYTLFDRHLHPYTQGLLDSIPKLNEDVDRLKPIEGMMPDPTQVPEGCRFCSRCTYAGERCRTEHPAMLDLGGGHKVRCFRYETQEVEPHA